MLMAWGTEQWDAFGSVAGGVFAGFAFGATLVLLTREARNRRRDEREQEKLRRDEKARLARLIIAESGYPNRGGGDEGWMVPVRIKNYSDHPVFDVRIWVTDRDVFLHLPVLEPGAESVDECATFRESSNVGALPTGPWLIFMDSNGRWWEREANSQPQQLLEFDPTSHVSRWRPFRADRSGTFPSGAPLP